MGSAVQSSEGCSSESHSNQSALVAKGCEWILPQKFSSTVPPSFTYSSPFFFLFRRWSSLCPPCSPELAQTRPAYKHWRVLPFWSSCRTRFPTWTLCSTFFHVNRRWFCGSSALTCILSTDITFHALYCWWETKNILNIFIPNNSFLIFQNLDDFLVIIGAWICVRSFHVRKHPLFDSCASSWFHVLPVLPAGSDSHCKHLSCFWWELARC